MKTKEQIQQIDKKYPWITRREDIIYGEVVVIYTEHRWYLTAYLSSLFWTLSRELGEVRIRRIPNE